MKTQFLLWLFLIGVLGGCRKTADPVQTVDDYYGVYTGNPKNPSGTSLPITVTIGKGYSSTDLTLLLVDDKSNTLQLKATLTGATFILTEKTIYSTNEEDTYRGDGTFSANKLTLNLYNSGRYRSSSSSSWINFTDSLKGELTKK